MSDSCTRQQSSSKLQFECFSAGNTGHSSSFLCDKHDSRERHRRTLGEGVEGEEEEECVYREERVRVRRRRREERVRVRRRSV